MKTLQLTIEGFESTLKPEPKTIAEKATNIFMGIKDYCPELYEYIMNQK